METKESNMYNRSCNVIIERLNHLDRYNGNSLFLFNGLYNYLQQFYMFFDDKTLDTPRPKHLLTNTQLNILITLSCYSQYLTEYDMSQEPNPQELYIKDINLINLKKLNKQKSVSYTSTAEDVNKLVKMGLLEKYKLPTNKKEIYVRCTREGFYERIKYGEYKKHIYFHNISYLTDEQRTQMAEAYKIIFELHKQMVLNMINTQQNK